MSARVVHRAYVITWFADPSTREPLVLIGREIAVFKKAVEQFLNGHAKFDAIYDLIAAQGDLLSADDGSNKKLGISKCFSGILMIGRTALAGGRRDGDESDEETVIRELREECHIDARPSVLAPLINIDENAFFTMDLAVNIYNALGARDDDRDAYVLWVRDHVANFDATDDKRSLDIVSLDTAIARVTKPDSDDVAFISSEMWKLAEEVCDSIAAKLGKPLLERQAIGKLADDLTAFQLLRKLPHHVAALEMFARSFE